MTSINPYGLAIQATRDVFSARAQRYRRLVIGFASSGLAAVVSSIAFTDARWLLILAALPPTVGVFFVLDLLSVGAWRESVMSHWVSGEMQLHILGTTLRRVPSLPPDTLEGLIQSLPSTVADGLPPAARSALYRLQTAIGHCALVEINLQVLGWSLAAVVPVVAGFKQQPLVLLSWAAVLLLLLALRHGLSLRYKRGLRRLIEEVRGGITISHWLAALCWQGVPQRLREDLIDEYAASIVESDA